MVLQAVDFRNVDLRKPRGLRGGKRNRSSRAVHDPAHEKIFVEFDREPSHTTQEMKVVSNLPDLGCI